MRQTEIAKLAGVKLIEQTKSGEYIVRYAFRMHKGGIRFISSEYPHKPTFEQIRQSFLRYANSISDDFLRNELLASFNINDYALIR